MTEVRGDNDAWEVVNVDALEIVDRLGFCRCEVFACRLMFGYECAWPEQIDASAATG